MNRIFVLGLLFLGVLLIPASPVEAQKVLNKEAVIGAAAGGTAGGIIGHQTGSKTEGAVLGSIAGYAIGTTIHRQKQRQRHLEYNQRLLREQLAHHHQQQALADQAPQSPPPQAPARPALTDSEKQQLLLQASPLFSVRRAE